MTTEQAISQGCTFGDDGAGFKFQFKGKWHPEEKLVSTGEYFADRGNVVFIYASNDGEEFEREDFPV